MLRIYLDGNIFDRLATDASHRSKLELAIETGAAEAVITPVVVAELDASPFRGVPSWFPVSVEPESVFVLGHAPLGMVRLGPDEVYSDHRGASNKVRDAIIAASAHALADILVTEDRRCRKRLAELSSSCRCLDWKDFCSALDSELGNESSRRSAREVSGQTIRDETIVEDE